MKDEETSEKPAPEALADIVREMRSEAPQICEWGSFCIGKYADRIEAAAEREARTREQAAADYALKRGEDIHTDRCRNCTELATGNAAALRPAGRKTGSPKK